MLFLLHQTHSKALCVYNVQGNVSRDSASLVSKPCHLKKKEGKKSHFKILVCHMS